MMHKDDTKLKTVILWVICLIQWSLTLTSNVKWKIKTQQRSVSGHNTSCGSGTSRNFLLLLIAQSVLGLCTAASRDIYLGNLTTISTRGYPIQGAAADDQAGAAVSGIGDFNGDGFSDLLITAPSNDEAGTDAGAAYVVFGRAGDNSVTSLSPGGFVSSPSVGLKMRGVASGHGFGYSAAGLGDTNGDGLADIVISSPYATVAANAGAGIVYVIYGRRCNVTCNTLNLNTPYLGYRIFGTGLNAWTGMSVSGAGDFNGDGKMDVLVGAHQYMRNTVTVGAAFLVLGRAVGGDVDLASFVSGSTTGLRIFGGIGDDSITTLGFAVSGVGDINQDGFADFAVAAPQATVYSRTNCGIVVVIFGHGANLGFDDIVINTAYATLATGFRIIGALAGDRLGTSLGRIGRFDGDVYSDFVIGYGSFGSGGSAMVMFGTQQPEDIDLSNYFPASKVMKVSGSSGSDSLGAAVTGAGDVNGDGLQDLFISAMGATALGISTAGVTYVLYGTAARAELLNLNTFVSGASTGFKIFGPSAIALSGASLSAAGDVNGDGAPDLVIGATGAFGGSGGAYVLYGVSTNPSKAPTLRPTTSPSLALTASPSTSAPSSAVPSLPPTAAPSSVIPNFSMAGFTSSDYGYSLYGAANNDYSGFSVSGGGDINGDKYADVIVGAKNANEAAGIGSGAVYVSFGHAGAFAPVDLNGMVFSDLTKGFKIMGLAAGDNLGAAVKFLGDTNGDKIGDFVVAAPSQTVAGNTLAGAAYVVYGTRTPKNILLSQWVTGSMGFRILGSYQGDQAGTSVSGAGDFNHDGYRDILIGAPGFDYNLADNCGAAYIIFGKNGTSRGDIDLSSLTSSAAFGLRIFGSTSGASIVTGVGSFVSNAGDFNGDGFEDVVLGAPYSSLSGRTSNGMVAVVFGRNSNFADVILGASFVPSATQGFLVYGASANNLLGTSVSTAGFFDKDAFKDVVVGAAGAGYALVLYGRNGVPSNIDLFAPLLYSNGFYISGVNSGDLTGNAVSNAGDVNGDGVGDILVSAADDAQGVTYLIYGSAVRPTSIALSSFSGTSSTGYKLIGAASADRFGYALSAAGDVNGDGTVDFIVGAYAADPQSRSSAGQTYVVFGVRPPTAAPSATPVADPTLAPVISPTYLPSVAPSAAPTRSVAADIDLRDFQAGTDGLEFVGGAAFDNMGVTVTYIGDFNGDGFGDVAFGSHFADIKQILNNGALYVLFGTSTGSGYPVNDLRNFTTSPSAGFVVHGGFAQDRVGRTVNAAGDVNGDGLADLAVHAMYTSNQLRGTVFVMYGTRTPVSTALNITTFITGATTGYRIFSVGVVSSSDAVMNIARGRDINGDGLDDLAIGMPAATVDVVGSRGIVYVIFGSRSAPSDIYLNSFTAGVRGFRVIGSGVNTVAGSALCLVDVDHDGRADVLLTHKIPAIPAFNVIVIYGQRNTTVSEDFYLSVFATGPAGYILTTTSYFTTGAAPLMAAVGDFNGDNVEDFAISLSGYTSPLLPSRGLCGTGIVVFGQPTRPTADLSLSDLNAVGVNQAVQFVGEATGDNFGLMGDAGDLNGDGVSDLLVSSRAADPNYVSNAGTCFVIFGGAKYNQIVYVDLASLQSGVDGFRINGAYANNAIGTWSLSRAGDLNRDGMQDFFITSGTTSSYARSNNGIVYILFGKQSLQVSKSPTILPTYKPSAAPSVAPTRSTDSDINLSGFQSGVDGLMFAGESASGYFGSAANPIGDFNGDSYTDFVMATPYLNSPGMSSRGAVYVLFGKASGTGYPVTDMRNFTTTPGAGFAIYGGAPSDRVGRTVTSAGDMNGDGIGDMAVQVMYVSSQRRGTVFVMYGTRAPLPASMNMSTFVTGPTTGFRIFTVGTLTVNSAIINVPRGGDVNGDGLDDLVLGVPNTNYNARLSAGAVYVIFGSRTVHSDVSLTGFADTTRGFRIVGASTSSLLGTALCTSDLDNDGLTDIVLSARALAAEPFDIVIIYGRRNNNNNTVSADIDMSTFTTGVLGYKIVTAGSGIVLASGFPIARIGDFNGDGVDDFALGQVGFTYQSRTNCGATFVLFGNSTRPTADVRVSTLGAGGILAIVGEAVGDNFGNVAEGGDLNGDGVNDLLVAAQKADSNGNLDCGTVYVVFGGSKFKYMTFLDMTALISGVDGFRINGAKPADSIGAGQVLGGAGDLNRDGIQDIFVSAYSTVALGRYAAGAVFIVYGKQSLQVSKPPTRAPSAAPSYRPSLAPSVSPTRLVAADINLSAFQAGQDGLLYGGASANDNIGVAANAIGDFNGDNIGDFAVSSPAVSANGVVSAGRVYVLFGQTSSASFPASDLRNFTASAGTGFAIHGGAPNDRVGRAVNSPGDLNGDGLSDLAVQVWYPAADLRSAVFIIYGTRTPITTALNITTFVTGPTTGYRILSVNALAFSNMIFQLPRSGDINGDGLDDLVVGAMYALTTRGNTGAVLVIFGSRSAPTDVYLANFVASSTRGFMIYGAAINSLAGAAVCVSDVDNDGLKDVVLSTKASLSSPYDVIVIYGRRNTTSITDIDLLTFTTGALGVKMVTSGLISTPSSFYLIQLGDFNGDNIDDFALGTTTYSYLTRTNCGAVFVMLGHSSRPTTDVALSTLGAGAIVKIVGENSVDNAGYLGENCDFNGDGVRDLLVGARNAAYAGTSSGTLYVIFGGARYNQVNFVDLRLLASGVDGFRINGAAASDLLGTAFGRAGDLNRDGLQDLFATSYQKEAFGRTKAGVLYIVYGKQSLQATVSPTATPTASTIAPTAVPTMLTQYHTAQNLSSFVPGPRGMRIFGATTGDVLGMSITPIGDVNNDGFPDFAVVAPNYQYTNRTFSGAVYIIFTQPSVVSIDLLNFVAGPTTGFRIFGANPNDRLGQTSIAAGDFNKDGNVDLLIGARYARNVYGAYFISLSACFNNGYRDLDLASFTAGTMGFKLIGPSPTLFGLGQSVSFGDVNSDGIDDILITAPNAQSGGLTRNSILYILLGKVQTTWTDVSFTSAKTFAATDGFRVLGVVSSGNGAYVAKLIPDISGDGYPEIVIGSFRTSYISNAYVVLGRAQQSTYSDVDLRNHTRSFTIVGGTGDSCGYNVASGGDFNGDGVNDLLLSCPYTSDTARGVTTVGAAYLIFGRLQSFPFPSSIYVANFTSGTSGFRVMGSDANQFFGSGIAACDLNRDGFSDFIVGGGSDSVPGSVFVIYGYSAGSYPAVNTYNFVSSTAGFKIVGYSNFDYTGVFVRPMGDLNQDGTADIAILSHAATAHGRVSAGVVTIMFGISTNPTMMPTAPPSIVPSVAPNAAPTELPSQPSAAPSEALSVAPSVFSSQISAAPSVLPVATAMPSVTPSAVPKTPTVSPTVQPSDPSLAPTTQPSQPTVAPSIARTALPTALPSLVPYQKNLNLTAFHSGAEGFRIIGANSGDGAGTTIASVDFNGDGVRDVVVGAPSYTYSGRVGAGAVYVIFGKASPQEVDLRTFTSGENGFRLFGATAGDKTGWHVSSAGDFNGDGIDDLAFSSRTTSAGALSPVYVLYGTRNSAYFVDTDLASFVTGPRGVKLTTARSTENSLSSVGDLNGDGFGDIVVGLDVAKPSVASSIQVGCAYVIFGNASHSGTISLTDADPPSSVGYRICGEKSGDRGGYTVSGLGDVNGDGRGDFVVGLGYADPIGRVNAGAALVAYGHSGARDSFVSSNFSAAPSTYRMIGKAGELFGAVVSAAGDFNGDGLDDILVVGTSSAPLNRAGCGTIYIIFGRTDGHAGKTLDRLTFLWGLDGMRIYGNLATFAGSLTAAGAGDVNQDGFDDIYISSPYMSGRAILVYGRGAATSQTPYPDLDTLDFRYGPDGFSLTTTGFVTTATGRAFARMGDVNRDGVDDIAITSAAASYQDRAGCGITYVVFGQGNKWPTAVPTVRPSAEPTRTPSAKPSTAVPSFTGEPTASPSIVPGDVIFPLSGAGASGLTILPAESGANSGYAVSNAGDVNSDGVQDIVIGAPFATENGAADGVVYVIYGSNATLSNALDLSAFVTGPRGFKIIGYNTDPTLRSSFGASVCGAGDINNDGIGDVVVGALSFGGHARPSAGAVFVVFGSNSIVDDVIVQTMPYTQGFRIIGTNNGGRLGSSLSAAGDMNGDGFADLLIGAPLATHNGRSAAGLAYVVFTQQAYGIFADIDLAFFTPGLDGSLIVGATSNAFLGQSVSGGYDINKDGFNDVIIGSGSSGVVHVLFGIGSGALFDTPNAYAASNMGYTITDARPSSGFGYAVAMTDDVNGDGAADILIGAPLASPGGAFVFFGASVPNTTPIDFTVDAGLDSSRGYFIAGEGDNGAQFGLKLSGAGDINGDGVNDLVVAAPYKNEYGVEDAGVVYVFFGTVRASFGGLSTLTMTPAQGYRVVGANRDDSIGQSVSTAGDFNQDGFSDIVIGCPWVDNGSGEVVVLYGEATVTGSPTLKPSRSPTFLPTSAPVLTPSAVPTVNPSLAPVPIPTVMPTAVPPTAAPSAFGAPTAPPTRQPTKTPEVTPTVAPSTAPLSSLTAMPTVFDAPSIIPTVAPTQLPIVDPTLRPTHAPHTTPSVGPTLAPSSGPSPQPTVKDAPSVVPTEAPSAPTFVPTDRPTLHPSVAPSPQPTAFDAPSIVPTVDPSSVPSTDPSAEPSTSPNTDPTAGPTQVPSAESSAQPTISDAPSVTPSEQPSGAPIADHTMQPTVFDAPSIIPTVEPSIAPSRVPTWMPTLKPSVKPTVRPTGAPSAVPSVVPSIQADVSAAVNVTPIFVSPSRTMLTVQVALTSAAPVTVYCAARLPSQRPVVTAADITSGGHFVAVSGFTAVVEIPGLQPATLYTVACIGVTGQGATTSLQRAQRHVLAARTLCCKSMFVKLLRTSVSPGDYVAKAVSLAVDATPSSTLSVAFSFVPINASATDPAFTSAVTYPTTVNLRNTSSSTSLVSLSAGSTGTQALRVTLTGASAVEYTVVYQTTTTLTVLAGGSDQPDLPVAQSARFSNDGSSVVITFDTPTDRAGYTNMFACGALLVFEGSSSATCQWTDASTIVIYPRYSAASADILVVGSTVTVRASTIKAACTGVATSACASWQHVASTPLVVIAPASAVLPVVSITVPSQIGDCNSLTVDLTNSIGSAGRSWVSPIFTVTASMSSANAAAAAMQAFLMKNYTLSPPTAIPSGLIHAGATYTIGAKLCNFLGACDSEVATVLVRESDSVVPVVSILGPALRSVSRSAVLTLSSSAYTQSCSGAVSYSNLEVAWSITSPSGASTSGIVSSSVNPAVYKLNSYSLQVGGQYKITLTGRSTVSGVSTTASVLVSVPRGSLVAKLAGGSTRSVRAGDRSMIDASSSYDEDVPGKTGLAAGLSFQWTCVQVSPTFSVACPLAMPDNLNGAVIAVNATAESLNKTSVLSVVVSDATRSSTAQVTVVVTAARQPLVTITSPLASLSNVNTARSLVLLGSVQLFSSCAALWTVDDANVHLSSLSTTPVTGVLQPSARSVAFNLALSAGVLPGKSTLVFTLSCGDVSNSLTITTNGAPLPGSFDVIPATGVELTTVFQFVASQWTDSDLPLTYQFGFQSVASVSNLVVVSKSELSFSSSTLPTGTSDTTNSVQCNLQVFDNLDATANATATVVVTSLTKQQQQSGLLSLIQSNTGSVDSVKNIISVVSATLNSANCSAAPNCTLLNRASCLRTSGECGDCVGGYIGDVGDRNSVCIPAATAYRPCTAQSDCLSWQLCDSLSGVCKAPQKTCSKQCNGRGPCLFIDKVSGDVRSSCALDNLNCNAVCSCGGDYSGVSCEIEVGDLQIRRQLRSSLIDGLYNLTDLEDPTEQSVSAWAASLYSLSLNPYELSVNDAKNVLRIANRTAAHAATLELDSVTDFVGLLQATDAVFSVQKYNYIPNDYDDLRSARSYVNNTAVGIIEVVSAFAGLLSKSKVLGQNSSSYFYDNFRVSSQLHPFASNGANVSIFSPQSAAERLTNSAVPSVKLSPSAVSTTTALVAVSTISVYPSAYTPDTSAFVSSPLYLQITSDTGEAASSVVSSLEFTFPFINPTPSYREPPTNFTFFCFNVRQNYTFTCPDTGHVLHSNCSSGRGEHVRFCPRRAPTCAGLDISSASVSVLDSCRVVSYTAFDVTCFCAVGINTTTSTVRRNLYTVENDLLDETGVSSMLATSVVILNEFADTFNAASDLTNPEDVIIVILMFSTLWGAGVLLLSVCFWRDHVALRKKVRLLSRQVVGVVTSLEGGTSIDDAKVRLLNYIQNVIPSVYAGGKTNFHRMVGELRSHHRYLTLFTLGDGEISNLSKVLIIVQVLTVETMQMFLLAVMYDLQEPDDDHSCPTFTTEGDCTARKSIFDDSQSYCQWSYNSSTMQEECSFHNIRFTARIFIFILILTSVFTALVNTPLDYFFKILAAPLIEDAMDQQVANLDASGTKRRFSIANGLRRMTAVTGQVAAGARRRSSAVLAGTQKFVKERFWYSGIVDSVSGNEKVIADRDISEDVQHLHKSAVQSLPSISKKSEYLQEQRRHQSLELKQRAEDRRSRGASLRAEVPEFVYDEETQVAVPVSPVPTAAEVAGSKDTTMKRLADDIICQRLLLPPQSYHTEVYDAQWGIVTSEMDENVSISDEALAAIEEDVRTSETEARELNEKLPLYTVHHGGLAILNMFLLDLLGKRTIAAKIFKNKFEEDFEETRAVSRPFKAFAIAVLVGCNAFFIYYSLLKALQKGQSWQYQYLQGCVAQMAVEIFLNETLECLWLNYVVPDLARKEVNRVTMILNHVVDQITSQAATFKTNSVLFLDAPSYLFASTKVAKAHPTLIESIVVMNFHSHLPGELSRTWPHYKKYAAEKLQGEVTVEADVTVVGSSSYKVINNFFFGAILAVGVYFTLSMQMLGTLSFNLQRIVIRVIQPLLLSGLTLMWLFASSSSIALIITFSCSSGFAVAFLWRQRYLHLEEVRRNSLVAPGLEDDVSADGDEEDDDMGPGSLLHLAQGSRSDSEMSSHKHSHSHGRARSRHNSSDSEAISAGDGLHKPLSQKEVTHQIFSEKIRKNLLAVLSNSGSDSELSHFGETSSSSGGGGASIDLGRSCSQSSREDSKKAGSDQEAVGLALYRQLKAEQDAKERAAAETHIKLGVAPSPHLSKKIKLSFKQSADSNKNHDTRRHNVGESDSDSSSGFEFDLGDLYDDVESESSVQLTPSPRTSARHSSKGAQHQRLPQQKHLHLSSLKSIDLPPVRASGVTKIDRAAPSAASLLVVLSAPQVQSHHVFRSSPHAAASPKVTRKRGGSEGGGAAPTQPSATRQLEQVPPKSHHAQSVPSQDLNSQLNVAASQFDNMGLEDSSGSYFSDIDGNEGDGHSSDGDSAFSLNLLPSSYTVNPSSPVQRKGKGVEATSM